ncbi:MAG: hypothetical protein ABSH09_06555 [Bryobacteraceae bacterium]|jgi:hypothetical protein
MRNYLITLAAGILFTLPATAQPKTLVALYKVQPGKMPEYVAALNKMVVPVLDRLVEDGTIQAYGIETGVLHSPGEPNLAAWFTAPDYARIQKADDAVLAAIASHPEEARILLEEADMNAHRDMLLESSVEKLGKVPDGVKPFVALAYFRVKPGKDGDFDKFGEKFYSPVYEKLIKDGSVYSYQVLRQAFHSDDPDGAWVVVTVPDMAALDKLDAAFGAKMKALTPAERSMMDNSGRELSDISAHRDYLMRCVAYRMHQ